MKTIRQYQICKMVGIGPSMFSEIINGKARPSWKTAKRLSSVVTGSTPEQWLEAPPETLRRIVAEFAQQERSSG
jgi:transcriptional regulator with XRE-family HTH domain